jgi:excinuclease ABC subunit C
MIADLCRFLEGRSEPVAERLREEMARASGEMRYERAAAIRDQLTAIERVVEQQKVVSQERIDSDVIAFARDETSACVQVFFIREGKLVGREYFVLEGTTEVEDREVVEAFVKQFYTEAAYVPSRVLLPTEIEEARIIEEWLGGRRGGEKVALMVPRRGPKRELVALAAETGRNACRAARPVGGRSQQARPGSGRSPGSAGARRPAEPDRVLRHLHHSGHRGGGEHGRL